MYSELESISTSTNDISSASYFSGSEIDINSSNLNENENENEEENETFDYVDNVANPENAEKATNYKYIGQDQLDEDDAISGQTFVLMSFISPERIMNCNMRGIKIRGVYASREKAEKALETLKKKDKYFDIFLGEVGKWLPWDPEMNQVEEVKYRNKKLDKIMNKVHSTEKNNYQNKLDTLNELVGRRKEQLDKEKVSHKDRIKSSVKEAIRTQNSVSKDTEPAVQPSSSSNVTKSHKSNRDPEVIKQRLRKVLQKREEAKNVSNSTTDGEDEKVSQLKVTSAEIKGKLAKMEEIIKNRSKK